MASLDTKKKGPNTASKGDDIQDEKIRCNHVENYDSSQVEMQARVEGVLKLFQLTYEKAKIALLLPCLFRNLDTLSTWLSKENQDQLISLATKFVQTKSQNDDPEAVQENAGPYILKILNILNGIDKIWYYLRRFESVDLSSPYQQFFDGFLHLQYVAELHLRTPAKLTLHRQQTLIRTQNENEKLKNEIKALKMRLRQQEIATRWKTKARQTVVRKLKANIADIQSNTKAAIEQEITVTNQQMLKTCKLSRERQNLIDHETRLTRAEFENMLSENRDETTELIEKKDNLIMALHQLIKTYKRDVGQLTNENNEIRKELEEQIKAMNIFTHEYQEQKVKYNEILAKRYEEETRDQKEKLLLFVMNRKAKIIQKYWHIYKQNKKNSS